MVVIILIVAISASIYLSVRAVHNDTFDYNALDTGTYELVKFSNPGNITELTIDYVDTDTSKPITEINEYAFNCDEKITQITIGANVTKIDGKSFYSCWSLQSIIVDDNNPNYCDIDGVLYTKDQTELICYPIDHDKYLRAKFGYTDLVDDNGNPIEELFGTTQKYDEKFLEKYNRETRTYVIPSTVTKIGKLSLNYSNIVDIYLPEGLKTIETMAVFRNTVLLNVYSYKSDTVITDTSYNSVKDLKEIYNSLPEGLEYIGSDAFAYDQGLSYLYIPKTVTYIGHHAFWDTVYKENKQIKGIAEVNVALEENEFNAQVKTGNQWRGQYDYMLFKKSVTVNYSSDRI